MSTLNLTLPSQNPGTHLLVKTDLEQLEQWLQSLPSGNMAKYVRQVKEAAINLNRTELALTQRLKLLKLMDQAYSQIHNFYRPLMHSGPFKGKHPPAEELSELNRLTVEMSFGYKILVTQLVNKRSFFKKNKEIGYAINLSLHYLGLILLESYELYSPIPMHVWSEIYQLYYYAEQKHISEEVYDVNHLNHCHDMIESTFMRNCLIALSNPYHLKRGDHWEVFEYLMHWTGKAILSEDPEDFSDKNCFVIDLNHDDKPLAMQTLPEEQRHQMQRFILTANLNLNICHQIDEINSSAKSPEKAFSKNVINRKALALLDDLLSSWEMKQVRQSSRYPIITRMEVIWGLTNIHKVLSLMDPLTPAGHDARQSEIKQVQETLFEDDWSTVNNSQGGICITQPREKVRDLDVGDLVMMRQSIQDHDTRKAQAWQLGVICWITGSHRTGTRVGIQYLKGDMQAVQLKAQKGNSLETRYQKAILLSGEMVDGLSSPTLLSPPGLYFESRPLLMMVGEEVQNIHARTKVSSSISVDRFFYQVDFRTQVSDSVTIDSQSEHPDNDADSEEEVIDLSATPGSYAEDFDKGPREEDVGKPTLDDVIIKKH